MKQKLQHFATFMSNIPSTEKLKKKKKKKKKKFKKKGKKKKKMKKKSVLRRRAKTIYHHANEGLITLDVEHSRWERRSKMKTHAVLITCSARLT
jgi:hypothetical protein